MATLRPDYKGLSVNYLIDGSQTVSEGPHLLKTRIKYSIHGSERPITIGIQRESMRAGSTWELPETAGRLPANLVFSDIRVC